MSRRKFDNITAGQITGAIQASQIGGVNASTIQGTIHASQIAGVNATAIVGAIQATQIAAVNAGSISGTIQGSQIANIFASTITIGLIGDSQIGSVSGSKLTVGTVDSNKLNATEIRVGGGGSKPGKFTVCNSGGTDIGQIGQLSDGNYGGWFLLFGAGGSGYSDAKVYTNSSGSLFIRDADFSISGSGSTIASSPTAFDSTYSSLGLHHNDGNRLGEARLTRSRRL